MRGSIYYQTSLLAKSVFKEGAQKQDKITPYNYDYKKVSSYQTMETYRRVWNNFGLFLRDEYGIKDFEKIEPEHIESYMLSKVDTNKERSKQYLEKISAALGKLETALENFIDYIKEKEDYFSFPRRPKRFDFSIRQKILDHIRDEGLVYDGYHNRVYQQPELLIESLETYEHRLAAKIQLFGGTRYEGVFKINENQLLGYSKDKVSNKDIGIIETKEKGGKVGNVNLSQDIYAELERYIDKNEVFKVDYQEYAKEIRQTCKKLNIKPEGTHGFRWTFAQNRIREYQSNGYTYDQALLGLSNETKHNRIQISEHYLY